jgi:Zn-finger nucleic acid-binding protein
MSDSWGDMRKAKENQFFEAQEKEALARLKARNEAVRKSPIDGQPMEQITMMGVVIDRCKTSGGVWLDNGELEQLLKAASANGSQEESSGWMKKFIDGLYSKSK